VAQRIDRLVVHSAPLICPVNSQGIDCVYVDNAQIVPVSVHSNCCVCDVNAPKTSQAKQAVHYNARLMSVPKSHPKQDLVIVFVLVDHA
jgi:hypothetical protein